MAHGIEQRDGIASVFVETSGGRKPAWHQMGGWDSPTSSLDEGMKRARHNFEVVVVPSYQRVELPNGDEFYRLVSGANFTMRTDTKAVLGAVGDRYTPLQNMDAFRALEPLLDNGLAVLDAGGTLHDGKDVWMGVKFNFDNPDVAEFAAENGLYAYGVISNNHAGEHQAILQNTMVRTVCANTIAAARREASGRGRVNDHIKVRHTKSVLESTMAAAAQLWGQIGANNKAMVEQFKLLQSTFLTTAQFEELVLDVALPLPELPKTARGTTMFEKRREAREKVTALWTGGSGHDGTPNSWYALNAVIEAIDHDNSIFRVRGDEARFAALLNGRLSEIKTNVADSLVNHALAMKA